VRCEQKVRIETPNRRKIACISRRDRSASQSSRQARRDAQSRDLCHQAAACGFLFAAHARPSPDAMFHDPAAIIPQTISSPRAPAHRSCVMKRRQCEGRLQSQEIGDLACTEQSRATTLLRSRVSARATVHVRCRPLPLSISLYRRVHGRPSPLRAHAFQHRECSLASFRASLHSVAQSVVPLSISSAVNRGFNELTGS